MIEKGDITYLRPPLIETALGAQFRPLPGLSNAHLGQFWSTLATAYPHVDDMPPLDPSYERFGEENPLVPALPRLRIRPGAPTRIRMTSVDRERMVQVQNGRLVINWIKSGDSPYPRFSTTLGEFRRVFDLLSAFLGEHGFPAPIWDQWEVTYVNRIPRGETWKDRAEWPDLIPGLLGKAGKLPVGPIETAACGWSFEILPRLGRLHVELTHGWAGPPFSDDDENLLLQFTARGPVAAASTLDDIERGLKHGHDAIVSTFDAVISDKARMLWEKK